MNTKRFSLVLSIPIFCAPFVGRCWLCAQLWARDRQARGLEFGDHLVLSSARAWPEPALRLYWPGTRTCISRHLALSSARASARALARTSAPFAIACGEA